MNRDPILSQWTVGVMGSGTLEHDRDARAIGALLARLEVNLLTGGGRGVMRAVSRAFIENRPGKGICIGVLPCASETDRATPKEDYPNEFVELPIRTHLPRSGEEGLDDLSRNHINILSCDAIVALPGGAGTASELTLCARYAKPAIAYSADKDQLTNLPASIPRVDDINDVERFLRDCLKLN